MAWFLETLVVAGLIATSATAAKCPKTPPGCPPRASSSCGAEFVNLQAMLCGTAIDKHRAVGQHCAVQCKPSYRPLNNVVQPRIYECSEARQWTSHDAGLMVNH